MEKHSVLSRRSFLSGGVFSVAAVTGTWRLGLGQESKKADAEVEISPLEDLMREHGVLGRALLIYEEIGRRIDEGQSFPAEALTETAQIIRTFIEQYHEKLEEDYLFPRFEKAGRLVDLVRVLLQQHLAGRRLTERILAMASNPPGQADSRRLRSDLAAFSRMYRPHKAREDTVLFPAVHSIASPSEVDSLGDIFEGKEVELFGERGFEKMVARVAEVEKKLAIASLAEFTPKA